MQPDTFVCPNILIESCNQIIIPTIGASTFSIAKKFFDKGRLKIRTPSI